MYEPECSIRIIDFACRRFECFDINSKRQVNLYVCPPGKLETGKGHLANHLSSVGHRASGGRFAILGLQEGVAASLQPIARAFVGGLCLFYGSAHRGYLALRFQLGLECPQRLQVLVGRVPQKR